MRFISRLTLGTAIAAIISASGGGGGGGGGTGPDWSAPYIGTADYVVTNDAEWDATMALGAATLAGKIIEYSGSNFTPRTIPALNLASETTIRSADASSVLPGITYTGHTTNLTLFQVRVKVQGWPKNRGACIDYGLFTRTNCKEILCDFSHGYGATLDPIPTDTVLPEYGRILHSFTATTTSQTQSVTWRVPGYAVGFAELWNDGAETIYVKFNANAVDTATTADVACPPGQRTRLYPDGTKNYVHFIAGANTSAFRFTTEQGLANYLADAYTSGGGSLSVDCQWIGNNYHDLCNAIKFWSEPRGTCVFIDNTTRRIYQDIFSKGYPTASNQVLYLLRNVFCSPFCLSGVDNLLGDAQDPHGDIFQMFNSSAPPTYGKVYAAGNRQVWQALRPGAGNQGAHFWASGDIADSYIVGDALFLNSQNGITVAGPSEYIYVYGNTVFNPESPTGTSGGKVDVSVANGSNGFIGNNLINSIVYRSRNGESGNVLLQGAAIDTFLPNIAGLSAAGTVAELETALTTAGAYPNVGAVANKHLIDWNTTDYTNVIKWSLLHPGVQWPETTTLDMSTLVYSDIRKVLGGPASMTIVPDAGTEYQVTSDLAGTAVVTAWTSAPGSIARGHFVQLRGNTSANPLTVVDLGATINGYHVTAPMKTKAADPTAFFDVSGAGPAFANTVNIGAGQSKITFRAMMKRAAVPGAPETLFSISGLYYVFELMPAGNFRLLLKDSANTTLQNNVPLAGTLPLGVWSEVIATVDLSAGTFKLSINGTVTDNRTFSAGTGLLISNRYPIFFAKATSGTSQFSSGSFSELQVWYDATADGSAPTSTPHKTIAGNAATVNADPWKQRADAT